MMTDIFPSEHHACDPSASVPSLHHPSYPSSLISWGLSEEDTSLYALALVQDASAPSFRNNLSSSSLVSLVSSEGDTSHYAPTLVQDPSVIDLPSQSDIIIAYVDPRFKFASKTQNTVVSWARLERAKVLSVACALIPLNVIH